MFVALCFLIKNPAEKNSTGFQSLKFKAFIFYACIFCGPRPSVPDVGLHAVCGDGTRLAFHSSFLVLSA